MTVTLELRPERGAAAEAEARTQGVAVETYLQTVLEQSLPRPQAEDADAIRQRRMEILSRLQGKYARLLGGSEEFSAQKAGGKAREERH